MKITCEFGEFEILGFREPGSQRIDRAVSVQSLVDTLGISFKKLPAGSGIRHVDIDGNIFVPLTYLNAWLFRVGVHPDLLNRLTVALSERSASDIGFLSFAHIQLQDALSALGAYYIERGLEAEYPVDEVEDSLYQIYCEFLTCGSYDPLLMERDRQPMSPSEAWMLSILEATTAALIVKFIHDRNDPDIILTYLQVSLKDRIATIGGKIAAMANHFTSPEDL